MPLKTPPINPDNSQKKKELENIKEGLESLKVYSELKNDFDQNNSLEEPEDIKTDDKLFEKDLSNNEIIADEKIVSKNEEFSSNESLDSKKEFFRLMAEKIKEEPANLDNLKSEDNEVIKKKRNIVNPVIGGKVSYYRKMILRFSFLTIILLLAVTYFSLTKLNVVAYTDKEVINDNLNFYAYSNDGQVNLERAIKASINRVELDVSETFNSSEEESLGGEIVGKVKIINDYSKNQPLVATTRLLSSDDKLFRLKNTVNVPAGGSVEVEIYADEPSQELTIAPGKFTIPGLWAGLQDKIYAESYESFEFKKEVKKLVSQKDLDDAANALREKLMAKAQEQVGDKNNLSQKNIFSIDSDGIQLEISNKAGEEVDTFSGSIKAVVSIITINPDDVIKIIKQKLSILDFDQNLSEVDTDSLNYSLLSFNSNKSLAEIKVDFSAKTTSGGEDGLINKKHLVNLNEKQIRAYLDGVDNVKSYELSFWPNFIKRAPMLVNRINIIYK